MSINNELARYNEFLKNAAAFGGPDKYERYLYNSGFSDGCQTGYKYALEKIKIKLEEHISDIQWDAYFTGRGHQLKKDLVIFGGIVLVGGASTIYICNKPKIDRKVEEIRKKIINKIKRKSDSNVD